jgi:predicted small secreted protein/lysophospholipase L1-like esterase
MKKWLVPAALAVLALSLTACYQGNLAGPRVAVIGDSITDLSTADITADLQPDYALNIQSTGGQSMAQMAPTLQSVLHDPQGAPEDVIVNLGTNDVFSVGEDATYDWRGPLASEVEALQSTQCVIFVTVNTTADELFSDTGTAEAINAAIEGYVAEMPNFHLLDWNALVRQGTNAADWIDPGGGLTTPFVHPNAAGQAELAALYDWYLHAYCG